MAAPYSDKVIISKTDCGFVLNFCMTKQEGVQEEEIVTQVGLSPEYAKRLLIHLYREIGQYEAKFGQIRVPDNIITELQSETKRPIGFHVLN